MRFLPNSRRALLKILLLIPLLAVMPASPAHARCDTVSNVYVRSMDALATHEQIHALNVEMLMIRNALAHPERYSSIYPLIMSYGRTHDRPKWQNPELLRRLCVTYGENLEISPELSEIEKQRRILRRNWAVKPINEEEDLLKRNVLAAHGLTDSNGEPISREAAEKIKLLKELEKVADNVERVTNVITPEELGKAQMASAKSFSRYLAPAGDDQLRAILEREARELQAHYVRFPDVYQSHVPLLRSHQNGDTLTSQTLKDAVARSEYRWRNSAADLRLAMARANKRVGRLNNFGKKETGNCPDFFRAIHPRAGAGANYYGL